MRVFAPGKLVLAGAYAVLEGAPGIAVAIDRGAWADDTESALSPTPEVRAALGDGVVAPHVDASAMFDGARKLGLGASAAILVASIAVRDARDGKDLGDVTYRASLFDRAREAHARAQGGGSGIDIAAAVYGGAIAYTIDAGARAVRLPEGLVITVFACTESASTSELRAAVDRLATRDAGGHRARMQELAAVADAAAGAVDAGDRVAFVAALARSARALARLGEAVGVAIVPAGFEALEDLAAHEQASFSVAGAGGGDVAVHVGPRAPSAAFLAHAHDLELTVLTTAIDAAGVRTAPLPTVSEIPRRDESRHA